MRSPCLENKCGLRFADKNCGACLKCEKRINYVAALGIFPDGPEMEKKEGVMAKKGTCRNCKREKMALPARGLCGLCNAAWVNAPEGEKEAALAAARARVDDCRQRGESFKSRTGKKKVAASDKTADQDILSSGGEKPVGRLAGKEAVLTTADLLKSEEPGAVITWPPPIADFVALNFSDGRDKKILSYVEELAKEARRSPDQQILWMLQDYMEAAIGR